MGNYIAQSDLDEVVSDTKLQFLTDDDNSGAIDTAIVGECIDAAEAEIDSFIAKQYVVPITGTIPEPVKRWAVALAALALHKRHPPVPDDILSEAMEVRTQLRECAKGEITLDVGGDATAETGYEPEFNYEDRSFTRDTFDGW